MNADTSKPDDRNSAELVTAQHELAAALDSIIGTGDYWRVGVVCRPLTLTHGWNDESVDTMVISSARTAYAYREDPSGREVWTIAGTADEVNAAVRALPAPTEPGAPDGSDHTPGPNGQWT